MKGLKCECADQKLPIEIWMERKLRVLLEKTFFNQLWNNVATNLFYLGLSGVKQLNFFSFIKHNYTYGKNVLFGLLWVLMQRRKQS